MAIEKVVIAGSGMAGCTAAIYTARSGLSPLVLEGGEPGGQLTLTTVVENYPGFVDGIEGPQLVENMRKQAERFGARFEFEHIVSANLESRPIKVTLSNQRVVETHTLIVASGARARMLGVDAEEQFMGRGLSTCATCDGAFYKDRAVIVVGGGDSAMEEATFLTRYASKVYVVHRRDSLRASKIMEERARSKSNVELLWNRQVVDLVGGDGGLSGVVLEDTRTKQREDLPIDGVFLAIGHIPNTEWAKGQLNMDAEGYLRSEPGNTKTNIPGIFAAGDVADRNYQQAVTAAGTGCMAALDALDYLEEHHLG